MLVDAFVHLLSPSMLLMMCGGVLLGIAIGVLPGINTGALMVLVLPFTFSMNSVDAVVLLISLFVGGVSGGLVTATLMRIPGEPNAVMTCMDGYPLAKAGFAGRALGLGNASSIVGGALSWVALVVLTPPLARVAVVFGPWEIFAVVCMALVLIASLSRGSLLKGLISALLGMLVAMPGLDPSSGANRLTFGWIELTAGLDLLPVILGIFAISQLMSDTVNIEEENAGRLKVTMKGVLISVRDYVTHGWNMIRSALIGIGIGILPGVGATIASVVSYTTAKNVSRHPEQFGQGSEEAIVAAEAANNATTGGTLIPLLALGIPGGLADAVLLGALMIHNLAPGPMLYVHNPEIVNAIMAAHLVAHVLMFIFMTAGVILFAQLMKISRVWIFPVVLVICVIGAYTVNGRMFDVWVMLAFGVVGYALEYCKVPIAPLVVGLVLGPLAEQHLRTGLMASGGEIGVILDRPIAMTFLAVTLLALLWPVARKQFRRPLPA
ncbi:MULTISPECIES: tripartite tricarboxylate transporter permease [unclassified Chelatococcus]|uniref:tripartite tricarboxylate transporter permease n=1 Tax=unclassified Chelatococcus TaxID=2638111 RepID=UPI001BCCAE82|nr:MULTISPECIES: tripartite tricarboxylate transporter permease [unclassified Chelatococcus]MBS7700807.1 tripartite tricarboxylate transporter permease [Chelatococcus sp. YT9]MBX3559665.1 tripartite tricarboxylate transporter permease [Chelatococcus sp.]